MKRVILLMSTIPAALLALGSYWMAPTRWDGTPDMSAGFQRVIGQTARWITDAGGGSIHDPVVQSVLAAMRDIGRSAEPPPTSIAQSRLTAPPLEEPSSRQPGDGLAYPGDSRLERSNVVAYRSPRGDDIDARQGSSAETAAVASAHGSREPLSQPSLQLDGTPRSASSRR